MLCLSGSLQTPLDISINMWKFYFHFVNNRIKLIIWSSNILQTEDWHCSASLKESGYKSETEEFIRNNGRYRFPKLDTTGHSP